MKKYNKIILLILAAVFSVFIYGCSDNSDFFDVQDMEGQFDESTGIKSDGANNKSTDIKSDGTNNKGITEVNAQNVNADYAGAECDNTECIVVYICGQVKRPGVYELPVDSRVYEAVNLAGGLTSTACESLINQAELLYDGQKLYIPSKEEMTSKVNGETGTVYGGENALNSSFGEGIADKNRVNINVATAEELMSIKGIGSTKANSIVEYREQNGRFSSTDQITNVSGIGPSTYEKIKDSITVK